MKKLSDYLWEHKRLLETREEAGKKLLEIVECMRAEGIDPAESSCVMYHSLLQRYTEASKDLERLYNLTVTVSAPDAGEKVQVDKSKIIRALQLNGFEHDVIMALRQSMETGDFSRVEFC